MPPDRAFNPNDASVLELHGCEAAEAAFFARNAFRQRKVAALHAVLHELRVQPDHGQFRLGDDQKAACVFVQAVDNPGMPAVAG